MLLLMGHKSWAQFRPFQTTRLLSTAGAGAASILSSESSILNPATTGFFNGSSFSYQSYKTSLQNDNAQRNENFPKNNNSRGLFMSDNNGPVKGGVAYISQNENDYERERVVLTGAAPIGDATSLGFNYGYLKDHLPKTYKDRHRTHHQLTAGLTHIIDEKTILALVLTDPTRTTPGEERVTAGFQYTLADRFTLIGDIGFQYTKNFSDRYQWAGAVQMNIFSDFFLRVGQFYDNIQKFKGTGWGASWMGPRFGVEFGQKYSEQFSSGYFVYKDEKITDTGLSAIIKF
jgi:hypothetical protein